jgi:uncharacterized protein YebE (UPF0316 family)
LYYIAYAGGFATGTFAGIIIEDKLSIGTELIRIITQKEAPKLVNALKKEGYIVTSDDVEGRDGTVKIVYVVIDRHDLEGVVKIIKKYNPNAFYSIEDVKFVSKKISAHNEPWYKKHKSHFFGVIRKGK